MKKQEVFVIERGIPLPPRNTNIGKGYTAVVRKLKPGESVFLDTCIQAAQTIVRQIGGRFGDYGDSEKSLRGLRSIGVAGLFAARQEKGGTRIYRLR